MAKKDYGKGKKCPGCGKPISNRAKKCKSCAKQSRNPGEGDSGLFLAWRYDSHCGIRAYSFDGVPEIRDSAGHEVRRGPRVICNSGKFYDHCPACGASADSHVGKRQDEMLYVASCPDSITWFHLDRASEIGLRALRPEILGKFLEV